MSLRDTESSTLRAGGDAGSTIRAPSTIMTSLSHLPQFDFDEMLLTSQVYLRNRNKTLAMNSRATGNGKMKDAETSVSLWDLPRPYHVSSKFDLQVIAQKPNGGNGNLEEARLVFLSLQEHHESLLYRYNKVKHYYFERQAHALQLEKQIEALKANDPDAWSSAAVESEKTRINALLRWSDDLNEAKKLAEKNLSEARQDIERLKRQEMDSFKIPMMYWEGNPSPGASTSDASTAVSTDPGLPRDRPALQYLPERTTVQ